MLRNAASIIYIFLEVLHALKIVFPQNTFGQLLLQKSKSKEKSPVSLNPLNPTIFLFLAVYLLLSFKVFVPGKT